MAEKGEDGGGKGDEPKRREKKEAAAFRAPAEEILEEGPVQPSDQETKDFLKTLKQQQKERLQQKLAEAREMEKRAQELVKRVKEQQKFRDLYAQHTDHVEQLAPQLGLDPNRPVTEIPEIDDPNLHQVEFTTIQEGRCYVRILFDKSVNRHIYQVIEPELTSAEREVLTFLRDTLVRTLDGRRGNPDQDWEAYLVEAIERAIVDHSILVDEISKQRLEYYLIRDFLGFGPVDAMMKDPMIEDISCDGPDIPVYVFHRQYESIKSNVIYEDETELDSFVIRLAQRSGKHISLANPLLDATLPGGSRLQATLSREVTPRGSSFTVRRFRADPFTAPDLVRYGTFSPSMAAFFWFAMEQGNSLIMAGGTASGKTTTLNAMAQFIPPQKKIVSIEDTREINLQHENWIAGITRSSGAAVGGDRAGSQNIDMYKLLESALRQRPEYLLVGEVRGKEALTLFQAMATGHATYSTLHADSVSSAVYRLENEPINVPRLMLQTLDAIAIQTQSRVGDQMVRRIKEVTEIVDIDPDTGDLLTNTVFKWSGKEDRYEYLGKSVILEKIMEKENLTAEQVEQEWNNRTLVIEWMVEKGIRHITDVSNVLSAYYSDPDELLEKVRASRRPAQTAVGGNVRGA